jgi:transposase InsO family protein
MSAKAAIVVPRYMGCRTIPEIPALTSLPRVTVIIADAIRMAEGMKMKRMKPMIFSHAMSDSRYKTREQAVREITEHIEVFYDRQRWQEQLGYLSPTAYERQFYARQVAA